MYRNIFANFYIEFGGSFITNHKKPKIEFKKDVITIANASNTSNNVNSSSQPSIQPYVIPTLSQANNAPPIVSSPSITATYTPPAQLIVEYDQSYYKQLALQYSHDFQNNHSMRLQKNVNERNKMGKDLNRRIRDLNNNGYSIPFLTLSDFGKAYIIGYKYAQVHVAEQREKDFIALNSHIQTSHQNVALPTRQQIQTMTMNISNIINISEQITLQRSISHGGHFKLGGQLKFLNFEQEIDFYRLNFKTSGVRKFYTDNYQIMSNVMINFLNNSFLSPYVGIGIGINKSIFKIDDKIAKQGIENEYLIENGQVFQIKDLRNVKQNKINYIYQIICGTQVTFTPIISLNLQYKLSSHLSEKGIRYHSHDEHNQPKNYNLKVKNHNFNIGLKFIL